MIICHKLAYLEEGMARNLEWATEDDDIDDVTYTITADSTAALDAVETLIDELCQRVGMPITNSNNSRYSQVAPLGLPLARARTFSVLRFYGRSKDLIGFTDYTRDGS